MPSRWRTCLVVIARDEAATITRLLDSVRPFVDELLVMDTGSSDDTVRLAEAAGARVARFEWIDDFSVARNAALDAAGADWHLVLDADEWLTGEGSGAALAALRTNGARFRRDHRARRPLRWRHGALAPEPRAPGPYPLRGADS